MFSTVCSYDCYIDFRVYNCQSSALPAELYPHIKVLNLIAQLDELYPHIKVLNLIAQLDELYPQLVFHVECFVILAKAQPFVKWISHCCV